MTLKTLAETAAMHETRMSHAMMSEVIEAYLQGSAFGFERE